MTENSERKIFYNFFSLPYIKFLAVALKLNVIKEEDYKITPLYKLKEVIRDRIMNDNLLKDLEKELEIL